MTGGVTEVTQVVLHERQGRDRGWWDQMHSCARRDRGAHHDRRRARRPRLVHACGYRLAQRVGAWKILTLDCLYERDTATAVVPGQDFTIAHELARFRLSYTILAWHRERRGYPVATDLLGDDRHDERDPYDARTLEWLQA